MKLLGMLLEKLLETLDRLLEGSGPVPGPTRAGPPGRLIDCQELSF